MMTPEDTLRCTCCPVCSGCFTYDVYNKALVLGQSQARSMAACIRDARMPRTLAMLLCCYCAAKKFTGGSAETRFGAEKDEPITKVQGHCISRCYVRKLRREMITAKSRVDEHDG